MLKTGLGVDTAIQLCYFLLGIIGVLLGTISGLTGYIVRAMAKGNRKEHKIFNVRFEKFDEELKGHSEQIKFIEGSLRK